MKKLFVIGLLAAMFASCYEDKGNYTYEQVMTFSVPNMNTSIKNRNAILGEEYTAYPPVIFNNWKTAEDTLRLKYYWVRSKTDGIDTLCEGRVFKWVPDVAGSAMGISVLVRDTLTGQVAKGDMQLTVTSQIGTGWALLHNYGGKTDMSFIRPDAKEYEDPEDPTVTIKERIYHVYPNYLTTIANPGIDFGTNPVKVSWYASYSQTKLLILQDNSVTIAGDTWKVDVDLAEEFAGGVPEGGFKDMITMNSVRLLQGKDGRVYLDQNWSEKFYQSRFMSVPMQDMDNAQELIIDEFARMVDAWFGSVYWCYDAINKRFLFVACNYYDVTAFYPTVSKNNMSIDLFVDETSMNRYIDLTNHDGYNYLFSAARTGAMNLSPNSSGGGSSIIAFFFEKDGEIYYQSMKSMGIDVDMKEGLNDYIQVPRWGNIEVTKWSELENVTADPAVAKISKNTPRAFINGKSQSSSGQKMDYMYFANDNIIYCLDFETKRLYKFYELPAGVNVKLLQLNYHDTELGVYSTDNTFRTLKCSPAQLNNNDFATKLIDEIENISDVQQIIYLRSNKSMFNMPATSGGYADRIVWD